MLKVKVMPILQKSVDVGSTAITVEVLDKILASVEKEEDASDCDLCKKDEYHRPMEHWCHSLCRVENSYLRGLLVSPDASTQLLKFAAAIVMLTLKTNSLKSTTKGHNARVGHVKKYLPWYICKVWRKLYGKRAASTPSPDAPPPKRHKSLTP
ncbi:uncharacterized protein AMSG_05777 [Thecamonas trahens ATCC 50062]|uniref:Uncharacterized protein n=1 Tax=Thecamonas trahens ATCC 50062 TaxID=461836 RepID=A0A0L0DCQ3_THETB|nr:hypothetical protein AMSG_05777 [Thecamonas trahens ATCC 50062]KNC50020.1 hypothetical protein AMSG_05777 [Thecamonas trahens ATCC 50062]|eukprot:XP_013757187.1 hypothetical protein AMSG_05777 [Thecamonas trahens ATCC 50062]